MYLTVTLTAYTSACSEGDTLCTRNWVVTVRAAQTFLNSVLFTRNTAVLSCTDSTSTGIEPPTSPNNVLHASSTKRRSDNSLCALLHLQVTKIISS